MAMRFSRRITAKPPAGVSPNKEVDMKKAELLVLVVHWNGGLVVFPFPGFPGFLWSFPVVFL